MPRRRKILLLLAGLSGLILILAVVLCLSAAKLINSAPVKEKIHAYLLEKAGAGITYGNSEFHLFPLPELIFHQVEISKPGKAEGSIPSLRVYPDLFSLMKGRVRIAKLTLESPHVTAEIPENTEKPSLEQIEEKVRSAVHYLVSEEQGLHIVIRDGRLDFREHGTTAFSFDLIRSRLHASENAVDVELTSRSSLWDDMSLMSSVGAEALKSEGTIRIRGLRPDSIIARLSKETAVAVGVPGVDLSVKFKAAGLQTVHASVESSVSAVTVSSGKKRLTMGGLGIKGHIKIEPKTIFVRIEQAMISRPALNLSGQYTLDRNSGIMTVDVEGKSLAVAPLRASVRDVWGDIPLIRSIFTVVQGGEVPVLHLHTSGRSLSELGGTENIRIAGRMRAGIIYIEAKDLTFRNVAGDVLISRGILDGGNVAASLGNNRCSEGRVRIGLKGKDAPFHIDMRVKADMEQLPSLLKQKNLLHSEAVLREMDRLHDLRGSAEGRLTLGDRMDAVHVKIAVDTMHFAARYEPLPFPLAVTGGKFFFDERTVGLANSAGSIGGSSFSGLTGRLGLAAPYDLEITGGRLSIDADEMFPWITSFEKIRPVLQDVRAVKGIMAVSSVDLRGPLYRPKEWKFQIDGEAKKVALDAAFLPGTAEEMAGAFAITQDRLSLKNMRAKIIDSQVTVTGSVSKFPSDIGSIDLALKGTIGQEVAAWISTVVKLPPGIQIRAPFSVADAFLSIEKGGKTAFSGGLLFGRETLVSLSVTKTPDSFSISDLTVQDRRHDCEAGIVLTGETVDVSFRGSLASETLKAIFSDGIYSDASLEGDFRTHIVIKHPRQSTAEGRVKGENIPVPWNRDLPLIVRHIELEAKGQSIVIDAADLAIGDMTFKARGRLSCLPECFAVAMDVTSSGIDLVKLEGILRNGQPAARKEKRGFLKDFPVRGTLKLRSDFLQYQKFRWEPFYADISFDGKTLQIKATRAALCGVSTTGSIGITEQGLKVDIALSAQDIAFRPTIVCLTDKNADFTGTFQLEARMKGEGAFGEIADRVSGTFTLSAKDGKILKSKSLNKTLDLLNKSENFKGQFPDLDRKIIGYADLKLHGVIRERKIQIEEGILDSSVLEIIARGYLDLSNDTLDLNALVAPLKTINRVLRKIPILGYILGGGLVSIPVNISGDMKDPQITFLSPSATGSEILGIVERTLKLPVTLVKPVFPTKNEK